MPLSQGLSNNPYPSTWGKGFGVRLTTTHCKHICVQKHNYNK